VARVDAPLLPETLSLGPVHLVVRDRETSAGWYEQALGLRRMDETALGDGTVAVVHLHEDPSAQPAGRQAGLYHYALLFPSREELARALIRLSRGGTPLQGLSDHVTHEAAYLADPDGNGIELAADRSREQWPTVEEMYGHGPQPLDVDALLQSVEGEEPTSAVETGLRVGHLHLTVGDLERALAFYRDLLGFELQAEIGTAVFLSAGGYHHHLGLNVWKGRGVGPAPPHAIGLEHWTIELPESDVDHLRRRLEAAGQELEPAEGGFRIGDPWEIALEVVTR
jgi:catechol 2,3-dioxygenase